MPSRSADAGPEALDQRVRLLDQLQHDLGAVRVLEVDSAIDRRPRLSSSVEKSLLGPTSAGAGQAVDAQDVGAEVGEHHRAERPGPDRADLDDADAGERTGAHAFSKYMTSDSATHTGLSWPSRSNVCRTRTRTPLSIVSTACSVARIRTREPTGTGERNRTLSKP